MSAIIRVTDSKGQFCTHTYFGVVCDSSIDWMHNSGTCRLRIASYSNGLFAGICGLCQNNVTNPWDGTFTVITGSGSGVQYFADTTLFSSVGGYAMPAFQTKIERFNANTTWRVRIFCSTPGVSSLWQGVMPGTPTSPLGVYINDGVGCGATGPGPGSITIEGFSP